MATSFIWKRPNLQFPQPFDSIFFDIDGVLIKATCSFRAADIAVAEYVVGRIHGGTEWVREVTPASAQLDYGLIGDLYHEFYWGAAELKKRYGQTAHYLPDWPGFVHREEMLFPKDLPARLHKAGIRHIGLITGRVGPEVDSALERMETYSGGRWWDIVIA